MATGTVKRLNGEKNYGLVIGAALLLVASLASPALAQLQMQEQTIGSPHGGPMPPDTAPKPTAAECQAQAKAHHMRGAKAKVFVRNCLKG